MAQLPLNLLLLPMQTQWSAILNPLLANPSNNAIILKNIALANGTTIFNHLLGRVMQGWRIVDIQGAATIYRPNTAPFNSVNLTLISNAAVIANIEVF